MSSWCGRAALVPPPPSAALLAAAPGTAAAGYAVLIVRLKQTFLVLINLAYLITFIRTGGCIFVSLATFNYMPCEYDFHILSPYNTSCIN